MARVAVHGDSCGGTIIASARSTINGASIAVIGDRITPHGPPNSIHRSARIVSGSDSLRIGGDRPSRSGDYATCGDVISASNTTDDSSDSWAPQPPQATDVRLTGAAESLYITCTIQEEYPNHCGALFRWKGPGEDFDPSREFVLPWPGIFIPMENMYIYGHTIMGLTAGVAYDVEVIATRVYAVNAAPVEITGTPVDPINPP